MALSLTAKGQTQDSLALRLSKLESNVNTIQLNLEKCDKQHEVGIGLLISGAVLSGFTATQIDSGSKQYKATRVIFGVGLACLTAGWVVVLDSHKFIGRASRK